MFRGKGCHRSRGSPPIRQLAQAPARRSAVAMSCAAAPYSPCPKSSRRRPSCTHVSSVGMLSQGMRWMAEACQRPPALKQGMPPPRTLTACWSGGRVSSRAEKEAHRSAVSPEAAAAACSAAPSSRLNTSCGGGCCCAASAAAGGAAAVAAGAVGAFARPEPLPTSLPVLCWRFPTASAGAAAACSERCLFAAGCRALSCCRSVRCSGGGGGCFCRLASLLVRL